MSISSQPCGKPLNSFIPRVFRGRAHRKGFALILTLTMMVLLTAIALGFLSLSSIALRSSAHEGDIRLARANAKMALMLAIGELQKQAGPDQRITATADIAGGALGARLADGATPQNNTSISGVNKGLSRVQNGSRYWTGVWRNSNTNDNAATEIYTKTPSPTLVKWLISGNEENSDSGGITPSSESVAVNSSGEVGNSKEAVVLVGEYTVGAPSAQTVPNYVSAPLVQIDAEVNGQTRTTGRYGWWVGDEGVKARLNQTSDTNSGAVVKYETLGADRRGWETVQGFNQFPSNGASGQERLGKVVSNSQASLLSSGMARTNDTVSRVFHSATTDSYGVISDPLAGGLRLDLSAYLGNLPGGPVAGMNSSPMTGRNVIPTHLVGAIPGAENLKGPKWERLGEFSEMYKTKVTGGFMTVAAPTSALTYGISPLILDFRLLLGAKLVAPTTPTNPASFKIYPVGKIAVSLANPYPYTLKWNSPLDLEVKYEPSAATASGYQCSRIWGVSGAAYFPKAPGGSSEAAVFTNTTFRIPAGELPPGEARAYTMGAPVTRPLSSVAPLSVPLVDFSSTAGENFENSIVMEANNNYVDPAPPASPGSWTIDVREADNTSLISADLKMSGQLLRRIERMELDNGYFAANQRSVTTSMSTTVKKPIGLMLYSFQLSQPGYDYALQFLPGGNSDKGLRGSTLRTYADFNVQATRFRKTISAYSPPPYFMSSTNAIGALPATGAGGDTGPDFTRNLAVTPLYWGRGPVNGTKKTILFSPPETMISLAQFQHADLTADDDAVSIGHQPGNAAGNSYASPYVRRENSVMARNDWTIYGGSVTAEPRKYYDMSYLLNTALWDSYFLSTIPRSGSPTPLNKAIVKADPLDQSSDLRDGVKVASHLLIKGAHNINSTEKDAWKALLAGAKNRSHPADVSGGSDALFARSLEQPRPGLSRPTGHGEDSYAGFRRLTDDQIDLIAEEITKQVRLRGPFVSLSQFVNRALVPLATDRALGRSGALQSAIDLAGANIKPDGSLSGFDTANFDLNQDKMNLQGDGSAGDPQSDLRGTRVGVVNADWGKTSKDLNPGAVASIAVDRQLLTPAFNAEQGFRSTGIPGWLTQADVLQVIGPSLAARSDTFRIRSYGEAVDQSGKTTARAWCEAVVQRSPLYIDPSNDSSARSSALTPTNRIFGRQFQVVSFRWLSPNEI